MYHKVIEKASRLLVEFRNELLHIGMVSVDILPSPTDTEGSGEGGGEGEEEGEEKRRGGGGGGGEERGRRGDIVKSKMTLKLASTEGQPGLPMEEPIWFVKIAILQTE